FSLHRIPTASIRADIIHDLDISLMSRMMSARIDAVGGNTVQRKEAAKRLNAVAQQAKTAEFVYAALEARLALGEMELKSGNPKAGRTHLETLEEDASGQGFQLIVQKATAVLGAVENQAALRVRN